jgi:hypothetical protein
VPDAAQRDKYAGRGVALLRQARTRGLFRKKANVEQLRKDANLAPLRQRADFKELLTELERKK